MENLYTNYRKRIDSEKSFYLRYLHNDIDWNERMIGIIGARGAGKTTLMIQHIRETFTDRNKALYVSLDNLWFSNHSLTELCDHFCAFGGTHIFIDEIHRYPNWAIELKNIYDNFPELHIVFTGSSILEIYKSDADLSRRAMKHELHGLSFREYLALENVMDIKPFSLDEILRNHTNIASDISSSLKILPLFKAYLEHGYYPFYRESIKNYFSKLENVVNTIIEIDLPSIEKIDYNGVYNIKKLLMILSSLVPYTPNIEKLSNEMNLNRASTLKYLTYLNKAELINVLLPANKGMSMLTKPEKIYLNNTNLLYALTGTRVDEGNLRETFFMNQLMVGHKVTVAKKGDFLIDGKYTIEVGGKNKSFDQIKDLTDSFVVADNLEIGWGNKIPLWLFGFCY
jgi:predicted AAA+ superfamily ATPase